MIFGQKIQIKGDRYVVLWATWLNEGSKNRKKCTWIEYTLKYRNLSKLSAPATPKYGHWTQFFPKLFKSSHFSAPTGPKSGHWTAKITLPPFGGSPAMRSLIYSLKRFKKGSLQKYFWYSSTLWCRFVYFC